MNTLWRLFSLYLPTVRDDGREYELPIYGSSSTSSSASSRAGQRHARPGRARHSAVPHVRDIHSRWKQQDDEEMKDLESMTRPVARARTHSDEESKKRRRSVEEPDDHPLSNPAATNEPYLPKEDTEVTVASTPANAAQATKAPQIAKSVQSSSPNQRHVRRRSSKIRDDSTVRLSEPQSASASARIVILQRELEQLQADLSSTKRELEHQRAVNVHLLAQKARTEAEHAQVTAVRNAQASELVSLRAALADRAARERTPDARDEELATLRAFLSKNDGLSGAQVLQSVQDLNQHILSLAAAVSEEFPLSRREPAIWTEAQAGLVRSALGDNMLAFLRDGDHSEDPSLIQLAVQAWEVRCCQDILDAFCAGLAPEVDRFLCSLFEEMQVAEPQATTSRWRALTHLHARNMIARQAAPDTPPPSFASTPASCPALLPALPNAAYPTPESTTNNTPSSQLFALALPALSLALSTPSASAPAAHKNLDGLRAILALAGCTDERGTAAGPLAERFGDSVARIADAASALARDVRENVSSAWFAVRVTSPAQTFDETGMENTYAGYGDESADVLCTVGLGLEVVRRAESRPSEGGEHAQNQAQDEKGLQRTLLLKPKVILESVKDLLAE